jgi:hypothetical protein
VNALTVLGWLPVIEHSSPADLGWSADSPAPEEALTAIAVARCLSADPASLPLLRWSGPFPHSPGRRVLAAGRTRGHSPLIQTRARFGDLQAAGRERRERELAEAEAGTEAVRRAGRAAWQQRGGDS